MSLKIKRSSAARSQLGSNNVDLTMAAGLGIVKPDLSTLRDRKEVNMFGGAGSNSTADTGIHVDHGSAQEDANRGFDSPSAQEAAQIIAKFQSPAGAPGGVDSPPVPRG